MSQHPNLTFAKTLKSFVKSPLANHHSNKKVSLQCLNLIWKIVWPFLSSWDDLGETKRGTAQILRIILSQKKKKKLSNLATPFLSHCQANKLTVALNLDNPRQVSLHTLGCDSYRAQTFSSFASKLMYFAHDPPSHLRKFWICPGLSENVLVTL